jgi:hypothetical protein
VTVAGRTRAANEGRKLELPSGEHFRGALATRPAASSDEGCSGLDDVQRRCLRWRDSTRLFDHLLLLQPQIEGHEGVPVVGDI